MKQIIYFPTNNAFLKNFVRILTVVVIISLFHVYPSYSKTSDKWPSSEPLTEQQETSWGEVERLVVLHKKDSSECISGYLTYVDNQPQISYEGRQYKVYPVSGNTSYDSSVVIDGVTYLFRCRLHPYE